MGVGKTVIADGVFVADELSAGQFVSCVEHAMHKRARVVGGFFLLDVMCQRN